MIWRHKNSNYCGPEKKKEGDQTYQPPSKRVSLVGQMVMTKTVKGAKLGDDNSDRYLIVYQVDKSKYYAPVHKERNNTWMKQNRKGKELWIAEVDGDCNVKFGPEQVTTGPNGHKITMTVLHQHMDLTTTTNGIVLWAMPRNKWTAKFFGDDGKASDGKGGTLLFTYRCQTC